MIDQILTNLPYDTFSDLELFSLLSGSENRKYSLLKRAVQGGELIRLRRGVYHLAQRYQRNVVNPCAIAQKIYGPSYVSFESALSYHGLIPESVPTLASATLGRHREFVTPLGIFCFIPTLKAGFYAGVDRVELEGQIFLMATPLKALADYVYFHRPGWKRIDDCLESLRIDPENLTVTPEEIRDLMQVYKSKRVLEFLKSLQEVKLG